MAQGTLQTFVATLVASLLATSTDALSHHSVEALYDRIRTTEFIGILTSYAYINPHVWYYFDEALPDGSVRQWAIEAGPPDQMRRSFIAQFGSPTLEMPRGEQYTVQVAPSRTEGASGFLKRLRLPNGKWLYLPPAANP